MVEVTANRRRLWRCIEALLLLLLLGAVFTVSVALKSSEKEISDEWDTKCPSSAKSECVVDYNATSSWFDDLFFDDALPTAAPSGAPSGAPTAAESGAPSASPAPTAEVRSDDDDDDDDASCRVRRVASLHHEAEDAATSPPR